LNGSYLRLAGQRKAPAIERLGHERNQFELTPCRRLWMALALIAAAAHGGFVALGSTAAFAIRAAAVLLAFLHSGLHVLACAARLAGFHVTCVFAATGSILGIGRSVMATAFAILHIGRIVMATRLGLRCRRRIRRRSRGVILRPRNQREREDEDRSKQSEFHKISFIKVMRTVETRG
jgi:hypothetical protein